MQKTQVFLPEFNSLLYTSLIFVEDINFLPKKEAITFQIEIKWFIPHFPIILLEIIGRCEELRFETTIRRTRLRQFVIRALYGIIGSQGCNLLVF